MRKIRNAASERILLGVISRKRNHCKIRDGHSPRRQLETPPTLAPRGYGTTDFGIVTFGVRWFFSAGGGGLQACRSHTDLGPGTDGGRFFEVLASCASRSNIT